MCTVDQHTCAQLSKCSTTFGSRTRAQCPTERKHTAARVQHCNSRDRHCQQLLWILHGSGALPGASPSNSNKPLYWGILNHTKLPNNKGEDMIPAHWGTLNKTKQRHNNGEGLIPEHWGILRKTKLSKNKGEDLIPGTGGFSKQATMAAQEMRKQQPWQQHTGLNLSLQHMMATMPHFKSGNTSSQRTWVYKTPFTQRCLGWQNKQCNK